MYLFNHLFIYRSIYLFMPRGLVATSLIFHFDISRPLAAIFARKEDPPKRIVDSDLEFVDSVRELPSNVTFCVF